MANRNTDRKQLFLKFAALICLVLIVILIFKLTGLTFSDFTPIKIKNFILQFGIISPIVFIGMYALRGVILVIPVGIMSLVGGLAFGKWWGTVYILIGATLGSALAFMVARQLGRQFIEQFNWLHKGRIKTFDTRVKEHGFRLVVFTRLIPLFQYDALNFGLGLSKIKFGDYILGTFLGMIPGGFINATLGDSLDNIFSVQFFVALAFFVLLMVVPTIYKKIKKRRGERIPYENSTLNDTGENR